MNIPRHVRFWIGSDERNFRSTGENLLKYGRDRETVEMIDEKQERVEIGGKVYAKEGVDVGGCWRERTMSM